MATSIEASELAGHERLADAIGEVLAAGEASSVELPGLGCLAVRSAPAYRGSNPLTGAEVAATQRRLLVFRAGAGASSGRDAAAIEPALAALATDVLAALRGAPVAVHVPRLGTFYRRGDEADVAFEPSCVLTLRANGGHAQPLADEALERTLANLRGPGFGVAELHAMLSDVRSTRAPEDDVLVDLPVGLPNLLRAALARSAELGNDDRFGFLSPMHREWAWQDFGRVDDGITPPAASADVFLFSAAPSRVGLPTAKAWALRRRDLGREDPEVVWCAHRREVDAAKVRVRLTTWTQLFALETVLGRDRAFLTAAQAARAREAVLRACPDVTSISWPARLVGGASDPWLRGVELP